MWRWLEHGCTRDEVCRCRYSVRVSIRVEFRIGNKLRLHITLLPVQGLCFCNLIEVELLTPRKLAKVLLKLGMKQGSDSCRARFVIGVCPL